MLEHAEIEKLFVKDRLCKSRNLSKNFKIRLKNH